MNKIKIIYLTVNLEIGGSERQILELASRLNRTEFEPMVVGLMGKGPLLPELEKAGVRTEVLNYPGIRFEERIRWRNIGYLFLVFGKLVKLLRQEKPIIVQAFLPATCILGSFATRITRIPYFIISKRCPRNFQKRRIWLNFLGSLADRTATLVTVNSEGLKSLVIQREKVSSEKIKLIYNGVDIYKYNIPTGSKEKRNEFGLKDNDLVVGIIANLIPYKGHQDFLQAAALVLKEIPSTKFLIVGRDDGIKSQLEYLSQELGIASSIIFTGTRTDIPQILQILNVQVLASHEESFSNAILEGMAAGKPLVVTNVGGNSEAVIDGLTGIVVPPNNPTELAKGILTLLKDPKKAKAMGEAAKQRIEKLFTIDKLIKSMEGIYKELVCSLPSS